ncbi:MAG: hypothetical protein Ct9H300mP30_2360 [Methanobacteriota archaeon]|nr:MAG: hypothetical protein Ct9H300mP30_2360 [Euryarchaeota archaeon]
MTVLIRGSSPSVREEVKRAFDDALGVAHRLSGDSRILPGGGGTQTHLARHLRAYAPQPVRPRAVLGPRGLRGSLGNRAEDAR